VSDATIGYIDSGPVRPIRYELLYFWSPTCHPCREVSLHVSYLERQLAGRVDVERIEVTTQPDVANRYQVMSVPTVLLLRDGRVVRSAVGARTLQQLRELVEEGMGE